MFNRDELQGRWKEAWGKIQERWGELTEDDFRVVNGRYDQLVGLIQRKTGETKAEVEKYLAEFRKQSDAERAEYDQHVSDAESEGFGDLESLSREESIRERR